MSARASYYAKNLAVCPNGEAVTPREKLVLIVLADSHQDKAKHFTYPSIDTIAADALCDRRSCQRYLAALERKGVIARLRPPNQGRGMQVFYFFRELDEIPEGWQPAALFSGDLFAQKGGKRAAKGRQKGDKSSTASIMNINPNEELKPTPPPNLPLANEGEEFDADQLAHLARCRDRGEDVGQWERYYREENQRRAEAGKLEAERRAEFGDASLAVKAVMRRCGFVEGRRNPLPGILLAVLAQEETQGSPPWVTGPRMVGAWQMRPREGPQYGPAKFFRDGHWRDV